jgi:hypothetical protein
MLLDNGSYFKKFHNLKKAFKTTILNIRKNHVGILQVCLFITICISCICTLNYVINEIEMYQDEFQIKEKISNYNLNENYKYEGKFHLYKMVYSKNYPVVSNGYPHIVEKLDVNFDQHTFSYMFNLFLLIVNLFLFSMCILLFVAITNNIYLNYTHQE